MVAQTERSVNGMGSGVRRIAATPDGYPTERWHSNLSGDARPNRRPVTAVPRTTSAPRGTSSSSGAGLTGITTALLVARAGRSVSVLEARELGAGTTGASTAKVSLLQGTTLSTLERRTSQRVVRAYVDGNREAQAWLERYAEEHGVAIQRRTAYTYGVTERGCTLCARRARGRPAGRTPRDVGRETTLPFAVAGAVALPDQLQVDPMELLTSLARDAGAHGVRMVEGVTAQGVRGDAPVVVSTDAGEYRADRVVVATNLPFLDRGGFFAPGRAGPLVRRGLPDARSGRGRHVPQRRQPDPVAARRARRRTARCCSSVATATSPAGPPLPPAGWRSCGSGPSAGSRRRRSSVNGPPRTT